jgi:hypothetical protein
MCRRAPRLRAGNSTRHEISPDGFEDNRVIRQRGSATGAHPGTESLRAPGGCRSAQPILTSMVFGLAFSALRSCTFRMPSLKVACTLLASTLSGNVNVRKKEP